MTDVFSNYVKAVVHNNPTAVKQKMMLQGVTAASTFSTDSEIVDYIGKYLADANLDVQDKVMTVASWVNVPADDSEPTTADYLAMQREQFATGAIAFAHGAAAVKSLTNKETPPTPAAISDEDKAAIHKAAYLKGFVAAVIFTIIILLVYRALR